MSAFSIEAFEAQGVVGAWRDVENKEACSDDQYMRHETMGLSESKLICLQ